MIDSKGVRLSLSQDDEAQRSCCRKQVLGISNRKQHKVNRKLSYNEQETGLLPLNGGSNFAQHHNKHHKHNHPHTQVHTDLENKSSLSLQSNCVIVECPRIRNAKFTQCEELRRSRKQLNYLSGFDQAPPRPYDSLNSPIATSVNMSTRRKKKCSTSVYRRRMNLFDSPTKLQLVLLLLFSNCLDPLNLLSISVTQPAEATKANVYTSNNNMHDDESDLPPPATQLPSGDDQSSDSDYNFTHIPFEYNTNKQLASQAKITTTTTTTTTRRPVTTTKRSAQQQLLRVTETELLPFAEFNVHQPTFSDLMKSWPPTTLHAASIASENYAQLLQANRRHARQQQQQQQQQRPKQQQRGGHLLSGGQPIDDDLDGEKGMMMRNHLNEDFDDTIVTADQSFDLELVPEPPTLVNYLGDLGDYIYVQLWQYLERGNAAVGAGAGADTTTSTDEQWQRPNEQNNNHQQDNEFQGQQPVTTTAPPVASQQLKFETIDELLDDHYYDQYENSQVLYYGAQLVREGDIFEIGCYMPNDQPAEWTKSGKALSNKTNSPRVIRRNDFLGAKQNFSLKIFEASLNDSGNYRCNKMSRKYHKLVVVPLKTTTTQLYVIQQRLLSVVNPKLTSASLPPLSSRFTTTTTNSQNAQIQRFHSGRNKPQQQSSNRWKRDYLLPGYLIVENQPLAVNCNITDEFVLRRLRENPQFQLAWYKNGKQLKGSLPGGGHLSQSTTVNQSPSQLQQSTGSRGVSQQQAARSRQSGSMQVGVAQSRSNPDKAHSRVQLLQANGRQLYIAQAYYSDAGEYLCSWSKLPTRQQQQSPGDSDESGNEFYPPGLSAEDGGGQHQTQVGPTIASNPLAAGSLVQLMAPVKLRPFKSTYHVRQGNELRLICQAQRGYPAAHISWYVGNRLVDGDFLREHADEYRVLHLKFTNQFVVTSSSSDSSSSSFSSSSSDNNNNQPVGGQNEKRKIVEINPIPSTKQQIQLTANGRGQWVEYHDFKSDKYSIESYEQQMRYLQMKLAQLATSPSSSSRVAADTVLSSSASVAGGGGGSSSAASSSSPSIVADPLYSQSSISVLVINSLNIERHTSRYACRATTRTNTDEVTTVIRVQASSTISVRPSTGRATLIPGQPLHFQCEMVGNRNAEFFWYRKPLGDGREDLLEPIDDNIEIHNERLTIHKPNIHLAGDYICRALRDDDKQVNPKEFATIRVRTQPYIDDFGLQTSHTGKSSIITDGDRLELTCTVRDTSSPVNITWLRSMSPDDESSFVPIPETLQPPIPPALLTADPIAATYIAADQNIVIESLGSHTKKLTIESVKHEHRSYYVCMADNGVTERTRKVIFIRVKDKLVALWPFLGIVAELFILFTIIHVWETQRAYKEITATPPAIGASTSVKRPATGASVAFESVPLTNG